jgi:hypothetical protein
VWVEATVQLTGAPHAHASQVTGGNCMTWIETRAKMTADVRDRLLREKENARVGVGPAGAAPVTPAPKSVAAVAREAKKFDQLTGRLGPPWNAPRTVASPLPVPVTRGS